MGLEMSDFYLEKKVIVHSSLLNHEQLPGQGQAMEERQEQQWTLQHLQDQIDSAVSAERYRLKKLSYCMDCDCDIDMLLISCGICCCVDRLTLPVGTDRWEERVQEAEQRKAVRTFARILYVYCVCDTR